MFVQHKQLKNLNIPAEKVAHLHSASNRVQLSFADHFPQLCQAYLLQISGGGKTLVVVAFYLTESQCSIFFVPQSGEVPHQDAEGIYEEGYGFIESMGFELNETDYHLLTEDEKQSYWIILPINQSADEITAKLAVSAGNSVPEPGKLCASSLKSLGRFFASM